MTANTPKSGTFARHTKPIIAPRPEDNSRSLIIKRRKASTLAGTQNPQHRSQPAKELAFCSAWATVFRLAQLKNATL